jgi:hypothetical protein
MLVGSGLKLELSMFIRFVMNEHHKLVPLFPLYMDKSIEMLMLGLDTDQLLGTTQQLNQVCQVGLQLLKKGTKFYEKHGSMNTGCDFFHPIYFSHIFPSPKDTHKEVFGSHLGVMIYPLDNPSKVFPKPLHIQFSMCF